MKRRGYDVATIASEKERLALYQEGLELIPVIESAFSGVMLGQGVGLYQAQGLDDYADDETCARYRASDEKEDWKKISFESLRHCNSSLSFFDDEGMRFHLPAYMICDLRGEYGFGLASVLAYQYPGKVDYFKLLSREQRIAVRLFLLHILHDPDYAFDRPHVERALNEYWSICQDL